MTRVNIAVEGVTDEVLIRKVLVHTQLECGLVRGRSGKHQLINDLSKYNAAAQFQRWLVVLDFDNEDCPVTYRDTLLPDIAENLIFRIAVREVEAWLLADREKIADYLKIPVANFPLSPDDEADPKRTLVNIVRKKGSKKLQADIVPSEGSGRAVGIGYLTRFTEMVQVWRPEIAAEHSDSLMRCIRALQQWQ